MADEPSLDQQIAALFQQLAGGAAAGPKPLGVPEGYAAPAPEGGTTAELFYPEMPKGQLGPPAPVVPAHYFEGDEATPGGLAVEDMAELQRKMLDAGLFTPAEAQAAKLGIWDASSVNAYTRLLGFANQTGLEAEAALNEYKHRVAQFGSTTGNLPTNPTDIRSIARQAFLARRGRAPSTQEETAFEAAYHATIDNPDLGVAPPDPAAFASEQVETMDPQGVTDYRILQAQDEWSNAIKGLGNG